MWSAVVYHLTAVMSGLAVAKDVLLHPLIYIPLIVIVAAAVIFGLPEAQKRQKRMQEGLKVLDNIHKELVDTEVAFLKRLSTFMTAYAPVLAKDDRCYRECEGFGPLVAIQRIHEEFLSLLRASQHERCAERAFLGLADFFKLHCAYVSAHDRISSAVRRACSQSAAMSNAVEDARRTIVGADDPFSLLIAPVQRLPRYMLMLQEMQKAWGTFDNGRAARVGRALEKVREVLYVVNEAKRDIENAATLSKMQSMTTGLPAGVSLLAPTRKLLKRFECLTYDVLTVDEESAASKGKHVDRRQPITVLALNDSICLLSKKDMSGSRLFGGGNGNPGHSSNNSSSSTVGKHIRPPSSPRQGRAIAGYKCRAFLPTTTLAIAKVFDDGKGESVGKFALRVDWEEGLARPIVLEFPSAKERDELLDMVITAKLNPTPVSLLSLNTLSSTTGAAAVSPSTMMMMSSSSSSSSSTVANNSSIHRPAQQAVKC